MPTMEEIRDVYRKRAGNYDFTVQLYHLFGFRMGSQAIGAETNVDDGERIAREALLVQQAVPHTQ